MNRFHGRLALQQRVIPNYRAPFFDLLASACEGGLSLFAGLPRPVEGITTTNHLQVADYQPGHNIHLFSGPLYLCYQRGLIDWLRDWNPDALIVEANARYLSTPSAVQWIRVLRRPLWAFKGYHRDMRKEDSNGLVPRRDGRSFFGE